MRSYPNLTLYRAFKNAANIRENETAIFYYDNRISFAKLDAQIEKWASILQNDFNIQKGDSVLIALPNIPQTIILLYAVNKIGPMCNMVHPYTPEEGIQKYYDEASSKLAILFDLRVFKQLKEYKKFNGNIMICELQTYFSKRIKGIADIYFHNQKKTLKKNTKFTFYRDFKNNGLESIEYPLTDEETSVLLHSASTTGISKTIMLSSKSFNFTAEHVPEILCMNEEELIGKAMMSVLPSFHGFGLCMTMHAPLFNGFGVVLIPKFSSSAVVKMMNRYKCIICIPGVPNVFRSLLSDPSFANSKYLKELRACFSGGDSLPSNIKEQFDSLMVRKKCTCRLYEGYGLTEALSVCVVNTHRHHKFGSVGYPISGVSVKIFNENMMGNEPNIVGEIAIKCDNSMLGYYQNEEATKATYHDGYLLTGDLGYLDEDDFLYFSARKKRVIKVSGVAVFPHEIEEVISHIPGVRGVCAIQIPDEKLTNAVKVFVVADFRNPQIIIDECRKHLISWAIPREIEFVNKLPYTKYKKVNFAKLQEEENQKRGIG